MIYGWRVSVLNEDNSVSLLLVKFVVKCKSLKHLLLNFSSLLGIPISELSLKQHLV